MPIVKKLVGRRIRLGGQPHSGWLPKGAAMPPPTPEVVITVDFVIVQEGPGSYFLESSVRSGDYGGDSWHSSLDDALHQAEFEYGITKDEWTDVEDSPD